jgi:hypothetical protein
MSSSQYENGTPILESSSNSAMTECKSFIGIDSGSTAESARVGEEVLRLVSEDATPQVDVIAETVEVKQIMKETAAVDHGVVMKKIRSAGEAEATANNVKATTNNFNVVVIARKASGVREACDSFTALDSAVAEVEKVEAALSAAAKAEEEVAAAKDVEAAAAKVAEQAKKAEQAAAAAKKAEQAATAAKAAEEVAAAKAAVKAAEEAAAKAAEEAAAKAAEKAAAKAAAKAVAKAKKEAAVAKAAALAKKAAEDSKIMS